VELRQAGPAALALALAAALLALSAPPASAQEAEEAQSQAVRPDATLTRPSNPRLPPRDHFLNAVQAARSAARSPKLQEELRNHDHVRRETFAKGPGRWQVSWFRGRCETARIAWDAAADHARRCGETWLVPEILVWTASALQLGPEPVRPAIARCTALVEETREHLMSQAFIRRIERSAPVAVKGSSRLYP